MPSALENPAFLDFREIVRGHVDLVPYVVDVLLGDYLQEPVYAADREGQPAHPVMHGDDDVRVDELYELLDFRNLHRVRLAGGDQKYVHAFDLGDDVRVRDAAEVPAVADAYPVHHEPVHGVKPPLGALRAVVERAVSFHLQPLDFEIPASGHDVLMVAGYDPGGTVVVVVMGHQDDVRGGRGRLDAQGTPVMWVDDDLERRILEFEAGVPVPPHPHAAGIEASCSYAYCSPPCC